MYDTTSRGLTAAQLYSTQSHQVKDLQGIQLWGNDITGWDLSGQDLRNSVFSVCIFDGCSVADLTKTNLSGADLRNAWFARYWWLRLPAISAAIFDSSTIYNQWTWVGSTFDPIAAGLTLVISPAGDLDANDALDVADVDQLTKELLGGPLPSWVNSEAFDMNGDSVGSVEDHRA